MQLDIENRIYVALILSVLVLQLLVAERSGAIDSLQDTRISNQKWSSRVRTVFSSLSLIPGPQLTGWLKGEGAWKGCHIGLILKWTRKESYKRI